MKVNILTNEVNIITDIISYPLNDNLPIVEIDSIKDIHIGYDKFIDNQIIHNDLKYNQAFKNMQYEYEIIQLKRYLDDTDYMAIKHLEGLLSTQEYSETKQKRQEARDRINELEALMKQ